MRGCTVNDLFSVFIQADFRFLGKDQLSKPSFRIWSKFSSLFPNDVMDIKGHRNISMTSNRVFRISHNRNFVKIVAVNWRMLSVVWVQNIFEKELTSGRQASMAVKSACQSAVKMHHPQKLISRLSFKDCIIYFIYQIS